MKQAHNPKRRWENLPAEGLELKDLDRKEILRTRELATQQNRISPDTGRDIGEILDRLGLRVNGVLTRAALVLIAEAFHRTGAVEIWGRGTNRVISMCKNHGTAVPFFEDRNGFLHVTFKTQVVAETAKSPTQSTDPVRRLIVALAERELSAGELRSLLGIKHRENFRTNYIDPALEERLIELTIPEKPNSRLQKYRLTGKGRKRLTEKN